MLKKFGLGVVILILSMILHNTGVKIALAKLGAAVMLYGAMEYVITA